MIDAVRETRDRATMDGGFGSAWTRATTSSLFRSLMLPMALALLARCRAVPVRRLLSYLTRRTMLRDAMAAGRLAARAVPLASCLKLLLLGARCLQLPGWRRSASA